MMAELLNAQLSYTPANATKRIGLVVLTTDHTTEIEFARLIAPERAEIFTARVEFTNPTTPENLRAMTPHIGAAAASILPGTHLDVIYYACTSGAVHIGDDKIIETVLAAKPGARVITPATAAVDAFKTLGVHKLALLTPYTRETSEPLAPYFEREAAIRVVRHCALGLEDDREMARLDADTLTRAALKADHDDADALFISCTALRAVEIAGVIERRIGKPVITSNQAAIWRCLRLLGHDGLNLANSRLFDTR